MPIDNDVYNRIGDGWWEEDNPLSFLLTGLNPVRFAYFRRVLRERLGDDFTAWRVLDVGCGGGFLAEAFAGLGCHVTGIDPSDRSLATARDHARQSGLDIEYRQGSGESLPFAGSSFDIVCCCDVLEHVASVPVVVNEIARVLRGNGIFLFDTVNRTFRSRLVLIELAQRWPTRVLDFPLHDWRMFITPSELREAAAHAGLHCESFVGIEPGISLPAALRASLAFKRGRLNWAEFGSALALRPSRSTALSYLGYAVKL